MVPARKGHVDVAQGQVHFRHGGRGPVLVLLHDSPRSSVLHAPNPAGTAALAAQCRHFLDD